MEFYGGTAPAPDAGGIGQHTARLRPAIGLDKDRCTEARRLKRADPALSAADIAGRLGEGATEGAVLLALATLRTKNMRPTRATINASIEAAEFLKAERRQGERIWEVEDRLLAELIRLRGLVAGASGRHG
jgi:hypothetical protein